VEPETFNLPGVDNNDALPADAIHVRLQRWRDRIALRDQTQEPGDPRWDDYNGNGSLDRGDYELKYTYPTPGQPQTWQEQHRTHESPDPSTDVILFRDPEPLPLYRRGGIVKEHFDIPDGESRLVWLVITVPEDMTTGSYGPVKNSPGLTFHINGQNFSEVVPIGLAIHVPCWDMMSERADGLPLWDYSSLPGTAILENAGIYLGQLSDRRAEVRMMGGSNTAFAFIGWPSRAFDGATTTTAEWGYIFSGLASELQRYQPETPQLPPFNKRRIKTIVFNFTSYDTPFLSGVWGSDPLNPSQEWVNRYTTLWNDMHAGLLAAGIDPDLYEIIIIPIDEPTDALDSSWNGLDPSCPQGQAPVPTCSGLMRCFNPKHLNVGTTSSPMEIETTVLFQHAASIIRTATTSWTKPPKILVNHDSFGRTDCDELLVDYEYNSNGIGPYNTAVTNLTDIWMSAKWTEENPPVPHPLATIGPTSTDEFWWYFFDTNDVTDLGPMRHAQSGLLMHDNGYSGHANFAFWNAFPKINAGAPYAGNGLPGNANNTEYNVHSWTTTHPRFWGKDNTVYFSDHFDDVWDLNNDGIYETDNSASFEVPNGEDIIPGRVTLARRQALEHHLMLKHMREGIVGPSSTYQLSTYAESQLNSLIIQATHPCHDVGDCPSTFASPDHVSMVMHDWLTDGYGEFESCPSVYWIGQQYPNSVYEALKNDDAWSNQ
jgi:hypothetical protein